MIHDIHSHTYYSYCGKDSPEDVIKNAISCGIERVGISDHYYGIVMSRKGYEFESHEDEVKAHSNALKRYYEHIKTLAEKYRDHIDVWCGVEIATSDFGNTLLLEDVDVSMFDYCLIEHLQMKSTTVSDLFEFAKRLNCKRCGLAHMDLFDYIERKELDVDEFLKRMGEQNIFWELNVNYDSIHGYREHQYVNNFFDNSVFIDKIRNSGVKLSIGFDGHKLEDYSKDRVVDACNKLEELKLEIIH